MPSEMVLITLCLRFAAAHILNIVRLCPYRLASDNSKSTVLWLGSAYSHARTCLWDFTCSGVTRG